MKSSLVGIANWHWVENENSFAFNDPSGVWVCVGIVKALLFQKWSQLQERERKRAVWNKLKSLLHSGCIIQCNVCFRVHVNDALVSYTERSYGVGACSLDTDCLKVLLPLATFFFVFFWLSRNNFPRGGRWAERLMWEDRKFFWCCCNSQWPTAEVW